MLKPKQVFPPLASPQVLPVFYHRQVTSANTSTQLSFLQLYSPEINALPSFAALLQNTGLFSHSLSVRSAPMCLPLIEDSSAFQQGLSPLPPPPPPVCQPAQCRQEPLPRTSQLIFSSIKQRGLGWKTDSSTALRSKSYPE